MVTILIWLFISVLSAAFLGLLFSIGTHREIEDETQAEYLSRWSDMKRLRK